MRRDPIKLTIGLGFTGVLALMGLISFISLSQMNTITEQMSALIKETNTKISAANSMRDSIRLRGESLYNMTLTDDFILREEYRLRIAEHALRYKLARDVLYSFNKTAREAKLLDRLMQQTRKAKALNDDAAENLLSDLPAEQIENALLLAHEARRKMLLGLDELVLLQENISRSIIDETNQYQEIISSIILLLSLAAFFIALYIAQLVIRETSRKNYEIRYQATHDELTKLINRKEFNYRLEKALNTAIENHQKHALCFLDLDEFKPINDNCGHMAGDELLIQLTNIIKRRIRNQDTLARLGGDEFGLLLENCSLEKAIEIAEGIVILVKNYQFNWQNKKFHIGVSIGLVMMTDETESISKALSQADTSCYVAKDMGRNQVQIHGLDNDHVMKKHRELGWVANINNDADDNRFSLYLQEIYHIQDKRAVPMYEVLLRLNDDDGTLVSPGSFIPAAERFSLMKDVDYWVIEKSFMYLSNILKEIPGCNIRLFINISANSLINHEFSSFVIEQFKKHPVIHDAVCLEISEIIAVKNISETADVIANLKKYNIKFALDDFGSGITSFSYLKNLPVHYLKIDGNIIKNMSHNTTDKAMIAAINQIGKVMNIDIIAKHVEDMFTLNQLKEVGIDYAQGYYLDKPKHIDKQIEKIQALEKKRSVRH